MRQQLGQYCPRYPRIRANNKVRYEYAKEIMESVNKSISEWQMAATIFSAILVLPTDQVKQLHHATTSIEVWFARDLQAIKGGMQYCM